MAKRPTGLSRSRAVKKRKTTENVPENDSNASQDSEEQQQGISSTQEQHQNSDRNSNTSESNTDMLRQTLEMNLKMQDTILKTLGLINDSISRSNAFQPTQSLGPSAAVYTLETSYNQGPRGDGGVNNIDAAGFPTTPPGLQGALLQLQPSPQPQGVPMSSLARVECVHPSLRRAIIQGKDVTLALLLIPLAELPDLRTVETADGFHLLKKLKNIADPRVLKNLTLPEFLKAFASFKEIMCNAFPTRRIELDAYERDIIDMGTRYPGTLFYEYHRAFSARAAAYLDQFNIRVDWAIRDYNLFTEIFSGCKAHACDICHSVAHATDFCPLRARDGVGSGFRALESSPGPRLYPRRIPLNEICYNFNSAKGCTWGRCARIHKCKLCGGSHPAIMCARQSQGQQENAITTPPPLESSANNRPATSDNPALPRNPDTPGTQPPPHLESSTKRPQHRRI